MVHVDGDITDHHFPCSVCGADLRFSPNHNELSCDHCGHKEPMEGSVSPWALNEMDLISAFEANLSDTDFEITRTAKCNNCGAEIEFDKKDHAHECAYCASPIVSETGENRHIKPRGLIPFQLDERAAREALEAWLGGLWFAPNRLLEFARRGRKMNGVYIPFWTYDAQTKTQYIGQRGDVYYVTMGHGKNRRRVRRIRWSGRRRGRVSRFFDDVLVLASTAMPKNYTDALQPWDLSDLQPYNTEYIAGFRAEAYTVTLADGWKDAQTQMRHIIRRDIRFDIGGDQQRIHEMNTDISEPKFKHILLPIYTLAFKFRGETFRVIINGQTGRVTGERPYSKWKIFFAVIIGLIIAGILLYFAETSGLLYMG